MKPVRPIGRDRGRHIKAAAVLLAITTALLFGPLTDVRAQGGSAEKVADFLDRLGLVELQLVHLEQVLKEQLPEDKRVRLARRLGDLYAGQLMENAEDEEASLAILGRIQALIKQVPQADTPALQVMLLQADYNHAEALAVQWIGNSADVEARTEAIEILQRITPELNTFQRELNAQVDHLTDVLANLPEGDLRDAKEQEFNRVQAVAGRATYFAGWSNYYLGLMRGVDGRAEVQLARETFRKLLDIRAEEYESLDAEWLGLESVWRCRALIGLGLSEAACGQLQDSRACFSLLDHANVPPEIQDQAAFWYLQGLLNAGRYDDAVEYASDRIASYTAQSSQGKVSVCVSLVRAAFGDRNVTPDGNRRRLGVLGLEGLARLGQQRTVEQLMQQYQIDLGDDGGFFLAWLAGRGKLATAEQTKEEADYRAAIEQLSNALRAQDADRQLNAAAQCRYELAWCWFQLNDYEQAARLYQLAVTGLKAPDPETAAKAAWMAFVSYQKLADRQPRFASLAIDVLRTLKRDFPDHPYAKRVDYFIDKMQRDAEAPEETIRRLEKIQPGDPSYLAALYDICVLCHQRWSQDGPPPSKETARAVVAAARNYLEASRQDRDETRKVKCCLLAAEVALADSEDEGAVAAAYLDQAAAFVDRLPNSSSLAAEYHYRRLQLAGVRKREADKLQQAEWLVQNAQGSAYELPALVVVARAADQRVEQSTGGEKIAAQQDALGAYQRLVQRLGTSVTTLQSSQNARVSLSRLADYADQLQQHQEAAKLLDALLAAFPSDRNYLRRSGLAHFYADEFELSLSRWRTLLSGLSSGVDGWYEARYYQIRCLQKTDPTTARQVLDQVQLLDPQLGPPPWRDRFRALSAEGR